MSQEREIYYTQIINEIKHVSDYVISNMHNEIRGLCDDTDDKKKTRAQMIRYIRENLELVSDVDLPKLIKLVSDSKEKEKVNKKMYDALLNVLNELLDHLDLDKIDDITDFVDIPRVSIATEDC